jgi:hypothetical protein
MTIAAIDRLVRHAVILEMNADSYRRKAAITRMSDQTGATTTTPQPTDKKPNIDAPATIRSGVDTQRIAPSKHFRGDRQTGHPNCSPPAILIVAHRPS